MLRSIFIVLFLFHVIWSIKIPPVEDIFNCTHIPPQDNPTDARKLRPSDIKVAMALGDSMTAGFAMQDKAWIFTAIYEWRGHVASVGGDPHAITIPNFIKLVSQQHINGPSVGRELPLDAIEYKNKIVRPYNPAVIHLNAAQSMAKAEAMIKGHGGSNVSQIEYIISQLQQEPGVDVKNDWKLLTIIIGANDLCVCCDGRKEAKPENWIQTIDTALTQIQQHIPRVFVNLVPLFNLSQVWTNLQQHSYCRMVWTYLDECPCLRKGDAERQYMDITSQGYTKQIYALQEKWNAKGLTDFYVGVQPFIQELIIPGIEFVSDLDCFHPSASANMGMAIGLWNSMLLPQDQKPKNVDAKMRPMCPTETTYLQ